MRISPRARTTGWRNQQLHLLLCVAILLAGCAGAETSEPDPTSPPSVATTTITPTETTQPAAGAPLLGSYWIDWEEDELVEAMEIDEQWVRENAGLTYLTFAEDGIFDFTAQDGPYAGSRCAGTYQIDGQRVILRSAPDRDHWDCGEDTLDVLVLDAKWDVSDDVLVLSDFKLSPTEDYTWWNEIYFGKPMPRVVTAAQSVNLRMGITAGFAGPQMDHLMGSLRKFSGGNLTFQVVSEYDTGGVADIEQQILGAVARGELDMGWVGSRALAELGVTSFDALTAPFLIDSHELQRAVVDSDITTRMLEGLDAIGVSGLGVIGGGLRMPIGVDNPIVDAADWDGITFHSFHSAGNEATITALGATYSGVAGWDRDTELEEGRLDGFENTVPFFEGRLETVRYMTLNVPLWPATGVLAINPDALNRLSAEQQGWLKSAVDETTAQSIDITTVSADDLVRICTTGGRLALATPDDLADLKDAVAPVYESLKAETGTAGFIAEIEALKTTVVPETFDVPNGCGP